MTRRVILALAITSLVVSLTGCVAATPTPDYQFTLIPTHTEGAPDGGPVVPPPDQTNPDQTPMEGTQAPTPAPLNDPAIPTQAAIDALATVLDIPPESITVVDSPLPVQWNDTSLGCPQPDETYTEAVIPGYLFTLSVGEQLYQVHTDLSGNAVVCFNDGDPVGSGTIPDPVVAEFIETAKTDLAERLGVMIDQIVLVRSEAMEWSDTSLGCREAGVEYEPILTAGYRIVLARNEQHYEYHTDQHRIFLCPNPTE